MEYWGFYIAQLWEAMPFFLKGLGMTAALSALSLIFGTIIGLLCGVARATGPLILRTVVTAYVDIMRGTPFLVQIFIIFFILPEWGLQLSDTTAAVLTLSVYAGAYICEIVASGIESLPKGQTEASKSLGMGYRLRMTHVILPQALRITMPSMVGQYVLLIKDSSIVSVIGVTDVTRVGWQTVQRVPEGLLVFGLVAILYFVICYPLIHLSNYLETRLSTSAVRL